jgi:putative ABC transport system permease protein
MLKYYYLLFFRNLRRQKLFSSINLLGLSAGIVSSLLIYLYVRNEFSYDRFHVQGENIYRINQTFIWGENDDNQFASLGPGVAHAIITDIPEVKQVVRIHPPGNRLVTSKEKNNIRSFDESGILAVDSNFFQVFTFPLLKGNNKTALSKPNSVVLSQTTANKYFGSEQALGKLLQIGEGVDSNTYEVTGIAADAPSNSYIHFDMLISMSSIPRVFNSNDLWLWTMFETFVVLDERTSPSTLASKLAPLPRKYAGSTLERGLNQTFDEYTKSGKKWELFVQPLLDIRLHSVNIYNRLAVTGDIKIVYILITVEIFIILLSCINFMNLSTAQYTRRLKESSIRKILGSQKYELGFHFFSEAFLFCGLAAIIGLGLTQLTIPYFNLISGSDLHFTLVETPDILLVLLGLIFLMSLLSGSYPAIFLSRFSPVHAMKGKVSGSKEGKFLRNGLVTFQFFISMILIVCTIAAFKQIKFLSQKDIGFNRENLMVIDRAEWINDRETFLHSLKGIDGIVQLSWASSVPPDLYDGDQFKAQGADKLTPLNYVKADEQFSSTLGLDIMIGRDFSENMPGDKNKIILNEKAVHAFGWTLDDSVLGKIVEKEGEGTYEVVGVIGDFNYWALQAPIQPMAIFHHNSEVYSSPRTAVVLRINPADTEQLNKIISAVGTGWKQFAGDHPFQYSFVDDSFEKTIQSEKQFSQGLAVFATIAILIASFGLLGMIIFTLEQRTKEIGIRKVVGASVANIWLLMVKDFTLLIFAAIVTSVPLSIWLLNKWLEDFNYKIELTPSIFIFAGGGMLILSLLITSYHVIKAALTNPVDVLKDE